MADPAYPKLREQLISFLEVRAHHRPAPAESPQTAAVPGAQTAPA
jgi:hypothetical protein